MAYRNKHVEPETHESKVVRQFKKAEWALKIMKEEGNVGSFDHIKQMME
jgi:hypothetical protein